MEKRIELEKRGRPAEEIRELNLDNCRATQIEGLTDDFKNLESLSLINVGLTTLKGFPNLPGLKKLDLSDNRISGNLNLLEGCPNLCYINLCGNKIKDSDSLEALKNFKHLKNLDLFNCEVTNSENYREKTFELLEGLEYLDGYDRDNQEADDDEVDDEDGEDDDDEDGEDDDDDDDEDEDGDGVVDVDEEDDDDDDDDDVEDEEDEDEEEVGLEYLQKSGIEDDSEGEDFDPAGGDEDGEEVEEEEEEEDDEQRGTKRKLEEEEDDD